MPAARRKAALETSSSAQSCKKRGRLDESHVRQESLETDAAPAAAQSTLASLGIHTSEQLVKALKFGGADREASDGTDKLRIARLAWYEDASTPIPRRAHLLADWLLGSLYREARTVERARDRQGSEGRANEGGAALFTSDPQTWSLLYSVMLALSKEEMRQVVGRQSVLPLLHSIGHSAQDEGRGCNVELLVSATTCIEALDRVASSPATPQLESITSAVCVWLEIFGAMAGAGEQATLLLVPLRILGDAWQSHASANVKRVRSAFLDTLLPAFCGALAPIAQTQPTTDTVRHLLSSVCRLSYLCIVDSSEEDDVRMMERLCSVQGGPKAMATILRQRCLALAQAKSLHTRAKDRDHIWHKMASHFLRSTFVARATPELASLLSVVEAKQLYPSTATKEALGLLTQATNFALSQFVSNSDSSAVAPVALKCLEHVQKIDEDAVHADAWKLIMSHLAHTRESQSAIPLLTALCSSCARTRALDRFTTLLFDGVAKTTPIQLTSPVPYGPLFDQRHWEKDIHPAMRNLVSAEQSIAIVDLICAKLSALSTMAIKESAFSATPAFTHSLRLSALIIEAIAVPTPAQAKVLQRFRQLYDGLLPILKEVKKPSHRHTIHDNSLMAAAIRLVSSIARRCDDMGTSDSIIVLAHFDDSQPEYLPVAEGRNAPERASEVVMELMIAVLDRMRRDAASGRLTSLAPWLDAYLVQQHSDENIVVALDVICTAYLPLLEKLSVTATLATLAQRAVDMIVRERQDVQGDALASSITCNAGNLELSRWRTALMQAIKARLDKITDKEGERLFASLLCRFPLAYVPRSLMKTFIEAAERRITLGADGTGAKGDLAFWLDSVQPNTKKAKESPSKAPTGDDVLALHARALGGIAPDEQLRVSFAFYIEQSHGALSSFVSSPDALLAPTLAHLAQKSNLQEYETCVGTNLAQLRGKDIASSETICRALPLLLCNGPEGSLAMSQTAVRTLLTTLAAELDVRKADDCLVVCHTLEALAYGKAILFRSFEASAIFALLTRIAAPSASPSIVAGHGDPGKLSGALFASITTILTTLLRLRPQAVAPLLPQLSILLSQMISLFRQSGLGGTGGHGGHRSALLPGWIDVRHPLGVSEARQMSRLCTAITARTAASASNAATHTPSGTTSAGEKQAGSVGRAFGNHVLPILLAYIRGLTFPDSAGGTLYVVGETRNELGRAMFALCEVMGSWQRNVLMDMLADEGERIVFRQFWRNYEAQRYRGE